MFRNNGTRILGWPKSHFLKPATNSILWYNKFFCCPSKGGFVSEGTDAFVISSDKQTLLFSWAEF